MQFSACLGQGFLDVVRLELGLGLQDALTTGAVPEQVQDRGDRDAQVADTGPPARTLEQCVMRG